MASPAVELRLGKIGARLAQDLVGLPKLAVLPLQSLQPLATSVGTPARLPLSTSLFLIHSFSVCAVQPIFEATETIAAHRDGCSCS